LPKATATAVYVGAYSPGLEASLLGCLGEAELVAIVDETSDDSARRCVYRLLAQGLPISILDEAGASGAPLSIRARALPGPSHHEVLNTTILPQRLRSVYLPLHLPPGSCRLRMEFVMTAPAFVVVEQIDFFDAAGSAFHVAAHHLEAHAVITNGFCFGRADEPRTIAVPAAPLTLTFDLGTICLGTISGAAICLSVTTMRRARVFERPLPNDALESYREPWNHNAVECGRTIAAVRTAERAATTWASSQTVDRGRLNQALVWLTHLNQGARR